MNLLIARTGAARRHCILQFGLGMVGAAISGSLLRNDFEIAARVPFDWAKPERRLASYRVMTEKLNSLLGPAGDRGRLSVIWSAGVANFYSGSREAENESSVFEENLSFVHGLLSGRHTTVLDYHFVSTAGGLFEGQRFVSGSSLPSPQRPYGRAKLYQEQLLRNRFAASCIQIYRPSSVYGPSRPRDRQGLINILVNNTLHGLETVLDSRVMALRDYVSAVDVGRFVCNRITRAIHDPGVKTDFLVTAKSTSIYEVLGVVRLVLQRQPRFRLDQSFGNHDHITFSHAALPAGWSPVSLETGIRQFLLASNLKVWNPPARA